MQPSHGGYEEATPLTAFVTLSLAAAGYRDHPIVRAGAGFIVASQRDNGSWPIDTDLATWVTVQATLALTASSRNAVLPAPHRQAIRRWLLSQQYTTEHPLTFGAPGGWGWSDLPGAMPDADDTSGVLLALHKLDPDGPETVSAAQRGIRWLMDLQNRDGGIPTFARGWGKLPFDRSCPDLTAHSLHAFLVWLSVMPAGLRDPMRRSIRHMTRYLERSQSSLGSWDPLWFGTQTVPDEGNPVYGTARTLLALRAAHDLGSAEIGNMLHRGQAFLVKARNPDGGWGAQPGVISTIEETAVALSALADAAPREVIIGGMRWLIDRTHGGRNTPPSPIGLYFARLWYSEELYPVIFATTALSKALAAL
jgi:squalene-hopene/tetraprenyl-beta-curcumene cyclase